MKPTTSLILLSYLIFTIFGNPLLTSAVDPSTEPVRDTAGQDIVSGTSYYILPGRGGNGGGLILTSPRRQTCPRQIAQDPNEANHGLPLSFSPWNHERTVRVNTDINIKFNIRRACNESTVWRFDANSQVPGPYFITLGGVEGNPGRETITNWFKIQRFEDGYNLQYCPTVCQSCRIICGDIGIINDNGRRRLGLSETPFKVVFKKA
ncbi:hypothetical protein LguiA_013415 [Lonicera macranthoides]